MAAKKSPGHAPQSDDFGVSDERYRAWIAHVFDRPTTENGWYFDIDPWPTVFDAGAAETVGLIGRTVARSGIDLLGFDDAQVDHGLNFIFSTACSDYFHSFARPDAPIALKVSAVLAIKRLYKDCFEPRCAPVLGHTSERGGNPLNSIAYMLWDVSPIIYHARDDKSLFSAIAEVLEDALQSSNAACIESALHGLGHAQHYFPDAVETIIDRFLAGVVDEREASKFEGRRSSLRPLRPELLKYAREAREGMVL